jgi:hypothetical protein
MAALTGNWLIDDLNEIAESLGVETSAAPLPPNYIRHTLRAIKYAAAGDRPERPKSLGPLEPIDERYDGMAHFIKNRQHMAPVPPNKGITKQEFRVEEEGVEILGWTEVPFDAATGQEGSPLPEFWAEVGKTISRQVRYTRDDGTVSQVMGWDLEMIDNFTGPMVDPADLGATEQIDEVEQDARPT